MKTQEIIYTNQKETQLIKKELYDKQNGICPLLNIKIPLEKSVADHQHKLKKENCSNWENGGKGLIRGCISFDANAIEGKITNVWKRYNMQRYGISLPNFLRNLADYLEEPPAKKLNYNYVYYTEKPKRIKVKKSEQNKINKYYLELYPRRKKIPKFTYLNDEVQRILDDIKDLEMDKALAKAERQRQRKAKKEILNDL